MRRRNAAVSSRTKQSTSYLCLKVVEGECGMEQVKELANGRKVLHGPELQELSVIYGVDVHGVVAGLYVRVCRRMGRANKKGGGGMERGPSTGGLGAVYRGGSVQKRARCGERRGSCAVLKSGGCAVLSCMERGGSGLAKRREGKVQKFETGQHRT